MIETIQVLSNFLYKFLTVVVVNCVSTPSNFQQCVRVDTWLIPDVKNYAPYLWGERKAYDTEKEYLENINRDKL